MFCSKCGEQLKEAAKFCHACGTAAKGQAKAPANSPGPQISSRSWLHSFGVFLFIPIFALIIVLLFWANQDSDVTAANDGGQEQQSAPPVDAAAMGNVHQTLERLKSRLEANPQDLVAIDSLAVMFSIAGGYDRALELYEQHLAIEPDNKDVKIALALTHHNLKDDSKAMSLLQELLDNEPTYAFALHYMAVIQASLHKHDEAEKHWQKIIDSYPGTEMAKMAAKNIAQQHTDN